MMWENLIEAAKSMLKVFFLQLKTSAAIHLLLKHFKMKHADAFRNIFCITLLTVQDKVLDELDLKSLAV